MFSSQRESNSINLFPWIMEYVPSFLKESIKMLEENDTQIEKNKYFLHGLVKNLCLLISFAFDGNLISKEDSHSLSMYVIIRDIS